MAGRIQTAMVRFMWSIERFNFVLKESNFRLKFGAFCCKVTWAQHAHCNIHPSQPIFSKKRVRLQVPPLLLYSFPFTPHALTHQHSLMHSHTHTHSLSFPRSFAHTHTHKRLTSSFSSTKFRQPSRGTKAVIFLPFLMSWTLQTKTTQK